MKEWMHYPDNLAAYTIIWLHGLGASGDDMRGIAEALNLGNLFVRHVFLDAPERPVTINQGMIMPAWYDIYGMDLKSREDLDGIESSRALIESTIERVMQSGFRRDNIILAGFSQGGAMALYTGLHAPGALGGVICLSGYLPRLLDIEPTLARDTPLFFGYGRYDTVVMPAWTQQTADHLKMLGYAHQIVEDYPMEHSVCTEEVMALSQWITTLNKQDKT